MSYHILRNTLNGLGNGVSCVSIPWTNQMGGTGTGSLCPTAQAQGQICGSTIAFQQALTDLGYPCDVTGTWMGTPEGTALNNWRAANGIARDYTKYATDTECGMIGQQWSALKGASPESEPPSGGTVSPIARRRIAAAASPLLASRMVASRTIKPSQPPAQKDEGGVAPVDEAAPYEEPVSEAKNWWSQRSTTEKAAMIGGGVILIGGIAYLALS